MTFLGLLFKSIVSVVASRGDLESSQYFPLKRLDDHHIVLRSIPQNVVTVIIDESEHWIPGVEREAIRCDMME